MTEPAEPEEYRRALAEAFDELDSDRHDRMTHAASILGKVRDCFPAPWSLPWLDLARVKPDLVDRQKLRDEVEGAINSQMIVMLDHRYGQLVADARAAKKAAEAAEAGRAKALDLHAPRRAAEKSARSWLDEHLHLPWSDAAVSANVVTRRFEETGEPLSARAIDRLRHYHAARQDGCTRDEALAAAGDWRAYLRGRKSL